MTGRQREICIDALDYFAIDRIKDDLKRIVPRGDILDPGDDFTLSIEEGENEGEVEELIEVLTRERAAVYGGREPSTTRAEGVAVLTLTNEGLAAQGFPQDQITDEMFSEIVKGLQKKYDETWNYDLYEAAKAVFKQHNKEYK